MEIHHRIGVLLVLACLLAAAPAVAEDAAAVDGAFEKLRRFEYDQPREPLRTIEMYVARSTNAAADKRAAAARLAAVLTDPKATVAAKQFVCGQLALVGSDRHVGLLVKLLGDAELGERARWALAAMPSEAAAGALRDAMKTRTGKALIGVVNSIGDRRDGEAVAAIAKLLSDKDPQVAEAAARALGKIGSAEAAEALAKAGGPGVRDAELRCAERLVSDGKAALAEAIYRSIHLAGGPMRIRVASLAGLVTAGGAKATPQVLAAMDSRQPELRATAFRLARRLPGGEVTAALAARLDKLDPAGQALLIGVLADRGDRAAAAAVGRRMEAADGQVAVAAVAAMARLGDAASVPKLAELAAKGPAHVRPPARRSLARLSADGVDEALLAAAAAGEGAVRAEAVAALAARRADGAEPALTKLTGDADEAVRAAALTGLSAMGTAACYETVVALLVSPASRGTAAAAERTALAVGGRIDSPRKRAAPLLSALGKAPAGSKPALLSLLSACGTGEALSAVRGALAAKEAAVADAAVRALSTWPNVGAADELLKIAQGSASRVHRALALRGYLRLARTAGGGADGRLAMLARVRDIAKNVADKRLLLGALSDVADAGALELAVSMADDAAVRMEAALAALKIAKAILRTDRPAVRGAMEKLAAKVDDAKVRQQAKALIAQSRRPARRAAGGTSVGLAPDKKRSDATKAALAKKAPRGYRLACYLDCGPDDADGAAGGPTLKSITGAKYSWAAAGRAAETRFATVRFDAREVRFAAAGLRPKRTYLLGLSWWDYDHNTRVQSVRASAGRPERTVVLLKATKLPSGPAGQKPAEHTLPIPRALTAAGAVRIAVRNEATPNVVVSEIWLWESLADAEGPAQPLAASRVVPNKRPDKPRLTPAPFRPDKKGQVRVLIVTGDDYPGHKWKQTTPVLAAALDGDRRLAIDVVETPDYLRSPKLGDYDVLVMHWMNWEKPDPGTTARENLRRYVNEGGGLVFVHFACGAFQGWDGFAGIAGRAWNPKLRGHDPRGRFRVNIVDPEHPITKGMKAFDTDDELYTCLAGEAKIHVLAAATSKVDKKDYAMAFVLTVGKGRVFHCPLGHDVKAFVAPAVRELFRRGTAWAAGLPAVGAKR